MILHASLDKTEFPFSYLIVERLAGSDLEYQYDVLSTNAKIALAEQISGIQRVVSRLPAGLRFGYSLGYCPEGLKASWYDVIIELVDRCRSRVSLDSPLSHTDIQRLECSLAEMHEAMQRIRPLPFLDDITTKNVIVGLDGKLSGIVDTDVLCYGDSLFTLALTKAAFANRGFDSIYTDAWTRSLDLDPEGQKRLSFYTSLFAADLLSEHGLRFNRDEPVDLSSARQTRLRYLYETEISKLESA